MKSCILGYDVRDSIGLGSSIAYYGVDDSCWGRPLTLDAELARKQGIWTGGNSHLWDELGKLKAWIEDRWDGPHSIICISLILSSPNPAFAFLPIAGDGFLYLNDATPEHLEPDWCFLGYDVADAFFDSVLCTQRAMIPECDSYEFTEYGCFTNQGEAEDCRQLAELKVPEHAPFFTMALHLAEVSRK